MSDITRNRQAMIRVKGMQFNSDAPDGEEAIESMMPGTCKKIGDLYYIKYEEVQEGFTEKTDVLLKAKPGYLEMVKKGLVNVHMIIAVGETHQTNYTTPFGNLLFTIRGKNIAVCETKDGMELHARYSMDANYEYLSDNDIRIEVEYRS